MNACNHIQFVLDCDHSILANLRLEDSRAWICKKSKDICGICEKAIGEIKEKKITGEIKDCGGYYFCSTCMEYIVCKGCWESNIGHNNTKRVRKVKEF
jgi:hypothetical protein